MADSIAERVKRVIRDNSFAKEDEIVPEARFEEDLDVDSLGAIEITMGLEEEFGIEIPDDVSESWVTVGACIAYCEKAVL